MQGYTDADFEPMTIKQLEVVRRNFDQVGVSPSHWATKIRSEKIKWLKRNLDLYRRAVECKRRDAETKAKET